MSSKIDIADKIGLSTLILEDVGAEAIRSIVDPVTKAGFKSLEICPSQFYSVDPLMNASLLYSLYSEDERSRLRKTLRRFEVVTVHGSSWWAVKIREGFKEEVLWQPYLELMRFASDVGAHIVSFHPLQRSPCCCFSDEMMVEYNFKLGTIAAEYADELNLMAAFENMPSNGSWSSHESLYKMITRIDSENLGLLIDVGHVALQIGESSGISKRILRAINRCIDKAYQFHVSGVHASCGEHGVNRRLRDHRPLNKTNIINYRKIMNLLKRREYDGPIIFEIYLKNDDEKRGTFQENLDACIRAKNELKKYWSEDRDSARSLLL